MCGIATLNTGENTLGFAISLINMPTSNTFARSIARINIENRHTSKQGFVFDKTSKLVKSPTVMCGSLFFPYSSPFSNAFQIFKDNRRLRVFGFGNDSLADYVISMCSETSFFPSSFFEETFCSTGTFFLELLSNISIPTTDRKKMVGCKVVSSGQRGNILNTPVNTYNIRKVVWCRGLDITSRVKIEYTVYKNKVCFSLLEFQKFFLSFSTNIRNFKSTVCSPDRYKLFVCFPRKDTRIISNCPKRLKLSLCFLVELVRINNFNNTLYNNLSGKRESIFNRVVKKFLEIVLSKSLRLPRLFANKVTSFISNKHSLLQTLRLFRIGDKFYLCS